MKPPSLPTGSLLFACWRAAVRRLGVQSQRASSRMPPTSNRQLPFVGRQPQGTEVVYTSDRPAWQQQPAAARRVQRSSTPATFPCRLLLVAGQHNAKVVHASKLSACSKSTNSRCRLPGGCPKGTGSDHVGELRACRDTTKTGSLVLE